MLVLEVKEASYTYPDGRKGISDVTLDAKSGEVLAVLGANGSGKTTLLLILAGLLRPEKGEVLLNGTPIDRLKEYRRMCSFLFQNPEDQLIALTVKEDIALGPFQIGLRGEELNERVLSAAKSLGVDHILDRRTHRLSWGEMKRVALAGVIAMRSPIVILDEPFSGMDSEGIDLILDIVSELKHEGVLLVLSTQNADLAAEIADRICLIKNGRVLKVSTAREVLTDLELLKQAKIRSPLSVEIYHDLFVNKAVYKRISAPITIEELISFLKTHLLHEVSDWIGSSGGKH